MPALLKAMSTEPQVSLAFANSASTSSLLVTSTWAYAAISLAAELADELVPALVVDVADDDAGALLDEPVHRRQPDPRAPAGDHRDLAVQTSCHGESFRLGG